MSEPTTAPDAEILMAQPRGFCAGVDRAIEIVERALARYGAPIYVRHEIVHNAYVVEDLRRKGAVFVQELEEVPPGSTVIFSAHGVSKEVRADAAVRGLNVFDATCPLVTKVHVEVGKMRTEGCEIIMIGHKGHPEVEGTMGQAEGGMLLVESSADVAKLHVADPERLAFVTQTTLSVDETLEIVAALKARFDPNDSKLEEMRPMLAARQGKRHLLLDPVQRPHVARTQQVQAGDDGLCQRLGGGGAGGQADAALARDPFRLELIGRIDHVGRYAQALRELAQAVGVGAVGAAHHDHHLHLGCHELHGILAVLGGIADVLLLGLADQREARLERGDDLQRFVHR